MANHGGVAVYAWHTFTYDHLGRVKGENASPRAINASKRQPGRWQPRCVDHSVVLRDALRER